MKKQARPARIKDNINICTRHVAVSNDSSLGNMESVLSIRIAFPSRRSLFGELLYPGYVHTDCQKPNLVDVMTAPVTALKEYHDKSAKSPQGRCTIKLMGLSILVSISVMRTFVARQGTETTEFQTLKIQTSGEGIERSQDTVARLEYLRSKCGKLCDSSRVITERENGFGQTTAQVDCKWLMSEDLIDASDRGAPYDVPLEFIEDYTMNGRVEFGRFFKHFKQIYLGTTARDPAWSKATVEAWKAQALAGNFTGFGNYGTKPTRSVFQRLQATGIKNMSVLVVGSQRPWLESICLAAGARHVTTLEYGILETDHPQLATYTPNEFRRSYLEGKLEPFDAVVSFSSVEHSGLGRYGDALNPWGDLMAVARIWCVTKDDGLLFLGVPSGKDCVQFNVHRIYGRVRYPFLVTNWKKIDSFTSTDLHFSARNCSGYNQKLLTFRKVSQ
jgi:hypothetical protein